MEPSPQLVLVDFGNVLYNIDFRQTVKALCALEGYNGAPVLFGVDDQDPLFEAIDRGQLTTPEFRAALRTTFGFTCSDSQLDAAWCAILKGPFPFAEQALRDIRQRFPQARLVLISNISELHLDHVMREFLQGARGSWDMTPGAVVDALYFSCRMGARKPDPAAFTYVCNAEGVEPADCVLFDDSEANCAAALRMGMRAVRVTPADPRLAFRELVGA